MQKNPAIPLKDIRSISLKETMDISVPETEASNLESVATAMIHAAEESKRKRDSLRNQKDPIYDVPEISSESTATHVHTLNDENVNNVIAELVVDTRSEDVKTALRIYKFKKSVKQLEREYSGLNSKQLEATLSYLNVSNEEEYLKHELVTKLICRIQNLLPEKCSLCSEVYCVKNHDKPFLPCSKCGQEAHRECIQSVLGMTDEEDDYDELDQKGLMSKLNPFNLSGFHYLCKSCEESTIPSKKSARKIKKKKSVAFSTQENTQDDNSSPLTSLSQSWDDTTLEDKEEDDEDDEGEGTKDDDETEVKVKTCRFYQSGTCKHGISGKECEFDHPKMCQKLLKHGTKQPQGCNLGKRCPKFHPKMCPTSISKLECFDSKCKLRHVKGTKRKREKEKEKKQRNKNDEKSEKNQESSENDFLGALRQLKTELLEAMDMKLAITLSRLHQSQTAVHTPQFLQPPPMMQSTLPYFQPNVPSPLTSFMKPQNVMMSHQN